MSGEGRGFLQRALLDNVGLKAISLVCSLGFFTFIHGSERATRTFSVGVVRTTPPPSANRQLLTDLPTEVAVTISGPRARIDQISPTEIGTVRLELSTGFETNLEVKPSMFDVPAGLRVEQVFPTSLSLRWDDVVERTLPVQIGRTGQPAAGFSLRGEVTTVPETVLVRGPKSVVDVMQFVRSAPYDVTGLTEGYHPRGLPLDPPPKYVTLGIESVRATVEVMREEREVPFKSVRVEVVGLPGATTKPSTVTVRLRGAPDVVATIEAEDVVPRVELLPDTDTKKPGSALRPVVVDVSGVEVEVEPKEVLVKW